MSNTPSTNLVRFNIQNAMFAIKNASGYATPVSFGTSIKMALEPEASSKPIYGDGQTICHLVNEKGKVGVLTLNNICDAYEMAMGRKIQTDSGLADCRQTQVVEHAIYFEVCNITKQGESTVRTTVAKTWLLGCYSTARPAESYDQTTTDVNESSFEVPFTNTGINLLATEGTSNYVDANGDKVIIYQVTKLPGEEGYETFEQSVPTPKKAWGRS